MMSLIAMAFIWTGSQIPVYIFGEFCFTAVKYVVTHIDKGAIPPYIYSDIGGADRYVAKCPKLFIDQADTT